jgi:hypothetical protein
MTNKKTKTIFFLGGPPWGKRAPPGSGRAWRPSKNAYLKHHEPLSLFIQTRMLLYLLMYYFSKKQHTMLNTFLVELLITHQ